MSHTAERVQSIVSRFHSTPAPPQVAPAPRRPLPTWTPHEEPEPTPTPPGSLADILVSEGAY